MPDGERAGRAEPAPTGDRTGQLDDRMMAGLIGSSGLHLLVLVLLVVGVSWGAQVPPRIEQMIPVNVVQLGDKSLAPAAQEIAPLPQEKAKETAPSQTVEAVPVAQVPPPPAARQAAVRSPPALLTTTDPTQKEATSRPVTARKPDALAAARLRQKSSPADDLGIRLKALAQLREKAPPMPPSPRQQDGAGRSNLTAASATAVSGREASYSVKDFIRAQVERRWNLDIKAPKGADWVVAIHLTLRPDGSVAGAEIVDTARYRSDNAYRDFALSARNAVLLSSPLTLPEGAYDIAKDIVLDFNSQRVEQ